jgi:hypothetical protein
MKLSKLFVIALLAGTLGVFGCSDDPETGNGGSGGTAGSGGTGGMPECQAPEACDDGEECTADTCASGVCENTAVDDGTTCAESNECAVGQCASGACELTPVTDGTTCAESNECAVGQCASGACELTPVTDGTTCGDDKGTCQDGTCEVACTEQGIRDAIAAGGGPHTFACDGPQTVVTTAVIVINNDVILDGEGDLTVDGNLAHGVFSVRPETITAELRGVTVTRGGRGAGGIRNSGTLTLTNSTVSGNTASGETSGGGINNSGTLEVTNSTVSGNTALFGSGISNSGTLEVTNSLISGDCSGGIISGGYNIESPGNTCGFEQEGDQVDVTEGELNLEELADNGGPTMTHALGAGSVAIDHIPAVDCEVDEDQRGELRPETGGTMCDVGAFEVQP